MVDWSEIGEDIVDQFLGKLSCIEDAIRSGSVCKVWRSVVVLEWKQRRGLFVKPLAPWLMLTKEDKDTRSFFKPNVEKTITCSLPHAQERRCWGSPYGWLVTVGLDLNIHLLHPLSQTQISLPPQPKLQLQSKIEPEITSSSYKMPITPAKICRSFLWKFCLLSNPMVPSDNCLVMAAFGSGKELAFVRPGDASWNCLESSIATDDVILFKGQIYSIRETGILRLCEISGDNPKAIDIADPPEDVLPSDRCYLVEMCEHLHLVSRFFTSVGPTRTIPIYCKTQGFGVFKFDFETMEWEELEELGDYAIFVGNNTSFAISTITHPYFKRNCIYFTDDHCTYYINNYNDMGVFDYEDATIQSIVSEDVFSEIYRPLFFMPTL